MFPLQGGTQTSSSHGFAPVDMSGPVGRVHTYPRNPVSHTAVAKLLPVLGKFLARGDYEHSEIQNVCVGLGPRYKHGHW